MVQYKTLFLTLNIVPEKPKFNDGNDIRVCEKSIRHALKKEVPEKNPETVFFGSFCLQSICAILLLSERTPMKAAAFRRKSRTPEGGGTDAGR